MEIFTLCWISRSTGIILPLLVKGCILSSLIALIDPWKFRVRAEASCRQKERLQRSELVWKQIHWKCQGPKLKGPHVMRWCPAGTWIQRRVCDKWACRQKKKFIRDRLLLSLKENWNIERQIILVEKNIPLYSTPSAPPAVHVVELLDNPGVFLVASQQGQGRKWELLIWLNRFL